MASSNLGTNGVFAKWLVIFDNVTDATALGSYWPHAAAGSVIITCKSPQIAKEFSNSSQHRIHLEPFSTSVATSFVLHVADEGNNNPTAKDRHLATQIAKAVGNHPLALHMVGCRIRRCGRSLSSFIQNHPAFERDLLFRTDIAHGLESTNQQSISEIFAMNIGSKVCIQPMESSAKLLIGMLAFLDPDGGPFSLFTGNTKKRMYVKHIPLTCQGPDIHRLCEGPDELDDFPGLSSALENPFEDPDV